MSPDKQAGRHSEPDVFDYSRLKSQDEQATVGALQESKPGGVGSARVAIARALREIGHEIELDAGRGVANRPNFMKSISSQRSASRGRRFDSDPRLQEAPRNGRVDSRWNRPPLGAPGKAGGGLAAQVRVRAGLVVRRDHPPRLGRDADPSGSAARSPHRCQPGYFARIAERIGSVDRPAARARSGTSLRFR